MRELAFRLHRGDDLKKCLEEKSQDISTAVVLSGVGCLYHAHFRLAKAIDVFDAEEDYEIVSLNGTISNGNCHVHIALSDEKGNVIGGHLLEGCLVNTTCEVMLGVLEEYDSIRKDNPQTGYDEIEFIKK